MERLLRRRGVAAALILIAALAIRVFGACFSPLEYDEIWSLERFSALSVRQILTDLALPNNHPVNTLFVKSWSQLFEQPQLIRLHSLVFGVLSVALTGVLARGLFHSRRAALWSMFFMAFSAPAIAYSELARGYGAQLFFLLVFACGIVWSGELRRFVPGKYTVEAALVVGAAGAVLSVPSAPIFLAATVLTSLSVYRRTFKDDLRERRTLFVALALAALAVAGYLICNYSALREAQKWGRELVTFADWEFFVGGTITDFVSYAALLLFAFFAAFDRRNSRLMLLFSALVIASAALFRAGPARVYLPLAVVVALGCGRGAQRILFRFNARYGRAFAYAGAAMVMLLGYYGYDQLTEKWEAPDYWQWFRDARNEPVSTLVVFPATAGYPLEWNNRPELLKDYFGRLLCDAAGERTLLVFSGAGKINGITEEGSEVERELPFPGRPGTVGGREAHFYRLVPLSEAPAAGTPLLIVQPPIPEQKLQVVIDGLRGRGVDLISLDPFFNYPLPGPDGTVLRSRLLFAYAPNGAEFSFVRAAGGKLYRIAPGS